MTEDDAVPANSAEDPSAVPRLGAREARGPYARMASLGASTQAAIPGVYAWLVTVAPAAWSRGAPFVARAAAVLGLVTLLAAPLLERSVTRESLARAEPTRADGATRPSAWARLSVLRPRTGSTWARACSVWGFVLSSALVWTLAPAALSAAHFDAVRGALGMLGWALFAFASAGPALRPDAGAKTRTVLRGSLKPRGSVTGGDGLYIGLGVAAALGLQVVGWGVVTPERAVLVRLVTISCGIAILGASMRIALARHGRRLPVSGKIRVRRALPWLALLLLAVVMGLARSSFR